jgi:glyoxylase-like metal-dependent hydrolase (beta-lactamase superfamily II)/rhodanese-related sulfurtransferase
MQIKQWENNELAVYSYGIINQAEKKVALIDPFRDPAPYLKWAAQYGYSIVAIIETHPHADFISGHLELHKLTGAPVYVHSDVGATYPHRPFNDGEVIKIGDMELKSLHTPGHSADSICILAIEGNEERAVFTGDTLFVGDCGRPDLREEVGKIHSKREELASMMYHSLRDKLLQLPDHVAVYPGHGAGSLCGKNISKEGMSTIGNEKKFNWSLQPMSEDEFILRLLNDQPFVPAYFPHDVELNRQGALELKHAVNNVRRSGYLAESSINDLDPEKWVVDGRDAATYKKGHLPHSINLMEDGKFETWLGTLIQPGEPFYLVASNQEQLDKLILRAADIGYERQIAEAFLLQSGPVEGPLLNMEHFKAHQEQYTIVDVRQNTERRNGVPFAHSISIPLSQIPSRLKEIPVDKPIVVHCAGGYRSAAASSMIQSALNGRAVVYDLGAAVDDFMP